MATGFFWDESCFWHAGGDYAFTLPLGGLVQPMAAGGLPESPETKRRLVNLMHRTGLMGDLVAGSAPPAGHADLLRVHTAPYLAAFKAASDAGGGEIGLRAPFAQGGYEIAAQAAGLAIGALGAVLAGQLRNAYALTRPPGHHCLPDFPNGFCLLANIAIAIRAAQAQGLARRIAVVDWDVHHGNGTEAIFLEDPDVLTISLHQDNNYPPDSGAFVHRGVGAGLGANLNIPLPPGAGHGAYLQAMERLVLPQLARFRPEAIVVACGFDASAVDPLGRMMASAATFGAMTDMLMVAADDLCDGRLMMAHEGGYSEVYVPFCGHAVLERLSGSARTAPDPLAKTIAGRQPSGAMDAVFSAMIGEMAAALGQE